MNSCVLCAVEEQRLPAGVAYVGRARGLPAAISSEKERGTWRTLPSKANNGRGLGVCAGPERGARRRVRTGGLLSSTKLVLQLKEKRQDPTEPATGSAGAVSSEPGAAPPEQGPGGGRRGCGRGLIHRVRAQWPGAAPPSSPRLWAAAGPEPECVPVRCGRP